MSVYYRQYIGGGGEREFVFVYASYHTLQYKYTFNQNCLIGHLQGASSSLLMYCFYWVTYRKRVPASCGKLSFVNVVYHMR